MTIIFYLPTSKISLATVSDSELFLIQNNAAISDLKFPCPNNNLNNPPSSVAFSLSKKTVQQFRLPIFNFPTSMNFNNLPSSVEISFPKGTNATIYTGNTNGMQSTSSSNSIVSKLKQI